MIRGAAKQGRNSLNNEKDTLPYFELNDLERAYHDKEWGTPCRNDHARFCFRYRELKRMK